MRIIVELALPEGTTLNSFQPIQIGCAIGRFEEALEKIGIRCASNKLTIIGDTPAPASLTHDCEGAWCLDCH